ncbi:MAG TPA: hypothetical protein VEV17_01470 [Bryobacteraceae bacterium]|nr:hypothetical protein [Bryobacteraceae bacterium]
MEEVQAGPDNQPSVLSPTTWRGRLRRWAPVGFFLLAALLFLLTNRAAYRGYFADDDFANIGWPTFVGNDVFIRGLLSPVFSGSHFRPVGFLFFRYAGRAFDLNFWPYVVILQLLHVLNAALLYLLLRRVAFSGVAAGAGAVFYAFDAAVMQVYWTPMFIFDLLCATLCLLTLLLYVRGRWIWGLATFWLAYKAKEVAVMLPAALAAYELLLGDRRWKRLIPYFAIALSFGLQALWFNQHVNGINAYALHFTADVLWQTVAFYSSAVFVVPLAGLVLLALPLLVRDRRLYIGLILMAATFLPMLALPGRLLEAFWYVPLIGLAMTVAAVAGRLPRWAVIALLILWLPFNYSVVRGKGRELLALDQERRLFIASLQSYARSVPHLRAVVYADVPPHMYSWGVEDGIRKIFGRTVDVAGAQDPRAKAAMSEFPMAVIAYDHAGHTIRGTFRAGD